MRKIFFLFFMFFLFCFCGLKQENVERVIENGVEIIVNHFEPYILKNTPPHMILEEELVIDTERGDMAELGITGIGPFDIDLEGNIYFLNKRKIFKFDNRGNFVKTFGREGQGPGEFQDPDNLKINVLNEIVVYDRGNNKFSYFNLDGILIKEVKINLGGIEGGIPIKNGNYLLIESSIDPNGKTFGSILSLYSSDFKKIKELDKREIPNPIVGKRLEATYHNLAWSVSGNKIFTGTQDRGYEINVYDLEGNLLKKIRKEFKKIPPSEEYKKKYMEQFKAHLFDPIRDKFYFPKSMPPFHYFLTDEEGRIYVMTYERGESDGEYIFDIFNPEGIFISRKSLKDFSIEDGLQGKFRNNRFYCVYEKESGFEKLIAYKVIWK